MNINYPLVGLALLLAVALVLFLILKNRKDRKKFEQDESRAEMPPEQHDNETDRL